MGVGYIKSNQKRKVLYNDANNLYVLAVSQSLPNDAIKFDKKVEDHQS